MDCNTSLRDIASVGQSTRQAVLIIDNDLKQID